MALSAEDANALKKQIEEIERLSRLLNKNISTIDLQPIERDADRIKALFSALNVEFNELTGDIGYAAQGFKKLVQEITNSNIGVRETTKGYNKLSSIAEKIQSYQRGFSELTIKDIKKLREQFEVEKQRLSNAQDILQDKKDLLDVEKSSLEAQKQAALQAARAAEVQGDRTARNMAISQARSLETRLRKVNAEHSKASAAIDSNNALLTEQDILLTGLDTTIKKTNNELEIQNNLLGLGGAAVEGIKGALDSLGMGALSRQLGFDEANEKMKDLSKKIIEDKNKELELTAAMNEANVNNYTAEELRNGKGGDILKKKQEELDILREQNAQYEGASGKIKVLIEGIKSMGKSLIENLKDPLVIGGFLLKQLADAFKSIDDGAGDIAKNMNLTYKEALGVRESLSSAARDSFDVGVNTKGMEKSLMAINQALGSNAEINKKDLETFSKLRDQAGYTNEELIAINKISMGTGKSVDDTVSGFFAGAKALSAQKGVAINVKQLLKETANVSNAIKLSLGGSTEALGKAAAQAKAVGMNLEQADKIASSLLNFEDSISAELEAELLTGKNINLERARLAALNGDIGEVAEEINRQLGGSAEFTKMNRLQQEAMAKAVGMTREELANSLVEQEALQRTGFKTAEAAKARYEELRKTMSAEEAAKVLGDEELARQYEQQNVQERFTQAVEKLKDVFVSIVDGPLGTMMGFIADILSNSTALYAIMGGLGGLLVSSLLPSLTRMGAVLRLMKMRGIGAAIVSIIKGAWESLGGLPVVGPVLAGAAIAGAIAFVKSQASAEPAGDVASPAKGKTMVSTKEGGLFELSANDDLAAAPGLLNKLNKLKNQPDKSNNTSSESSNNIIEPAESVTPTPTLSDLNKPTDTYLLPNLKSTGEENVNNAEIIALMREFVNGQRAQVQVTKELANRSINVSTNIDGEKLTSTVNNNNLIKSKMQ